MDRFIRCQALTKSGTQCKSGAMSLTPFCGVHQGHIYRIEKVKYCTWCDTKIDGEHEWECVSQKRQVVLSFNFIYDMPRSWSSEDIEWHMNCKMHEQDMFEIVQDAIHDYADNEPVNTSYTEERDAFVYRYVTEANSTHLSRMGSAERDED